MRPTDKIQDSSDLSLSLVHSFSHAYFVYDNPALGLKGYTVTCSWEILSMSMFAGKKKKNIYRNISVFLSTTSINPL